MRAAPIPSPASPPSVVSAPPVRSVLGAPLESRVSCFVRLDRTSCLNPAALAPAKASCSFLVFSASAALYSLVFLPSSRAFCSRKLPISIRNSATAGSVASYFLASAAIRLDRFLLKTSISGVAMPASIASFSSSTDLAASLRTLPPSMRFWVRASRDMALLGFSANSPASRRSCISSSNACLNRGSFLPSSIAFSRKREVLVVVSANLAYASDSSPYRRAKSCKYPERCSWREVSFLAALSSAALRVLASSAVTSFVVYRLLYMLKTASRTGVSCAITELYRFVRPIILRRKLSRSLGVISRLPGASALPCFACSPWTFSSIVGTAIPDSC